MLTTPEMKEFDSVFPGENWFLYWKTSPSLWEAKLREYNGPNPLFVPIYWGYHTDFEGDLDFGQVKPENDLARLCFLANQVGREIVFLMNVTPAPFLPNGGIPSYLAKNLAWGRNGVAYAVMDNNARINHLYSFYDIKTYQAFRKFTMQLGQYFSLKGLSQEIYALECGYIESDYFVTFFEDTSMTFQDGFRRFLDNKAKLGELPDENSSSMPKLKKEYEALIFDLYQTACHDSFSAHFGGTMRTAFLGAHLEDLISRSSDIWENRNHHFYKMFKILGNNLTPSTVLLPNGQKKGVLERALRDILTEGQIRQSLKNSLYEGDHASGYFPLVLLELYTNGETEHLLSEYRSYGFMNFLEENFRWVYRYFNRYKFVEDDVQFNRVYCFSAYNMQIEQLQEVLRLFMNGAKILLDTSEMSEELVRRLELFILENELKAEKVFYQCEMTNVRMGDGNLILYRGKELKDKNLSKLTSFWVRVFENFAIKHLNIEYDEDVFYFWKARSSSPYELNYEEVRRLSLYNPTSYKKKARVLSSKNFVLAKVLDQYQVEIANSPVGVDLILNPGGAISLDFGYFES